MVDYLYDEEQLEDWDDDWDESAEDIDDDYEFLPIPGFGLPIPGLGGGGASAGGFSRPGPRLTRSRPGYMRRPSSVPVRPRPSIRSPLMARTYATQEQVQDLQRQTHVLQSASKTFEGRIAKINDRINNNERKNSAEHNKLNRKIAAQNVTNRTLAKALVQGKKQINALKKELEQTKQMSLLMALLASGKKEYKITSASDSEGNPIAGIADSQVTLEPQDGKSDLLLPLLLTSGGDNTALLALAFL